jgi:multidrug efflux pump subunit AcrB
MSPPHAGLAGALAQSTVSSKLTPLFILGSLALGAFATILLPREEEPQIIVPMVDVMVQMPGASAAEVEDRVTRPMEQLLWEIPGVEYIYSISQADGGMCIVRYKVGTNEEDALVRIYNKLFSHYDLIPPGASEPLIKFRSIDDVPILALTFHSSRYSPQEMRHFVAQVQAQVKEIADVSQTMMMGGLRREFRVELDPLRLLAYHMQPSDVVAAVKSANAEAPTGYSETTGLLRTQVRAGSRIRSADDLRRVTCKAPSGETVFLGSLGSVLDGPEDRNSYVLTAEKTAGEEGRHSGEEHGPETARHDAANAGFEEGVTLAIAKRKGTNATVLARHILDKVEALRGSAFPTDLAYMVTRDYGETAKEKSDELLKHLLIATLSVALLIALALGWRESGVVLVAVPVTLALTLLVFLLMGFTLNRITLFALIFSIGILVDDAIVVVENIVRHMRLPESEGKTRAEIAVAAVAEVGNPTILATFAVIAAILPMAFVRGLMGPYMRPIPLGASAAMVFSLAVAFIVSPWASARLLKATGHGDHAAADSWSTRLYRRIMGALITNPVVRTCFLIGVVVLLVAACAMVPLKLVKVKMLPFDNKSEFQVIVNMPEYATLEMTQTCAREMGRTLLGEPEVVNVQVYAGTSGPFNFNGLVRHYFMRSAAYEGDLQVNLLPRHDRKASSHEIAQRVRPKLREIAERYHARIEVAEVPPGPPVLQTLVAEVYGPDAEGQIEVARQIRRLFEKTPGVVDVDWYVPDSAPKRTVTVDLEKACKAGVQAGPVVSDVRVLMNGEVAGLAQVAAERENVPLRVQGPLSEPRDDLLGRFWVRSMGSGMVSLDSVTTTTRDSIDRTLYRKNLMSAVYVTADLAGEIESPVYAILNIGSQLRSVRTPDGVPLAVMTTHLPKTSEHYAMKWDGEWHITYEVFRDLGIAFAVVLVLIYVLVVGWFQSFTIPVVILAAIPFSLVGILPGHALMRAFFSATSMIGFIAGAGIVVRNSIILVDFAELQLHNGAPLEQAVVDAGAIRFRPMMLTAAAVVVGSSVILFDPIFQGLAVSLMAGEIASLLLSRMTVPILYYLDRRRTLPRP